MASILLLSVVFLSTIPLVCCVSWVNTATCCPTCSTQSISPLNSTQLMQIKENMEFISEIQANPGLLRNASYQRPIVTITGQQGDEMLRNFPELFMTRCTFDEVNRLAGVVTHLPTVAAPVPTVVAPAVTAPTRRRRATFNDRLCTPVMSMPLVIATTPEGQVAQFGQPPGQGQEQFVLSETCANMSTSQPRCGVVTRHVPALIIIVTTDDNSKWSFGYVSVDCCVALE